MLIKEYNEESGTVFSIECNKLLYRGKSEYQKIEVYESINYGSILLLDNCFMITEKGFKNDSSWNKEDSVGFSTQSHRTPSLPYQENYYLAKLNDKLGLVLRKLSHRIHPYISQLERVDDMLLHKHSREYC